MKVGDNVVVVGGIYNAPELQPGGKGVLYAESTWFGAPGFKVVIEGLEGPHEGGTWNFAADQLEVIR